MPYPITPTSLGSKNLQTPELTPEPVVMEMTRVWNWQNWTTETWLDQDLYLPQNRPANILIFTVGPECADGQFTFESDRLWAGLGGRIYIPSFPQLNRRDTSWPHAT